MEKPHKLSCCPQNFRLTFVSMSLRQKIRPVLPVLAACECRKVPHYAGLRCGIFKRQDLTPLLDRMREVWIDASQK